MADKNRPEVIRPVVGRAPLFNLRLDRETRTAWEKRATREGRTLAGFIKNAVRAYLEKRA